MSSLSFSCDPAGISRPVSNKLHPLSRANFKTLWFLAGKQKESALAAFGAHQEGDPTLKRVLMYIAKLPRHEAEKGNFFAEPGLIFLFSVLLLAGWYELLSLYFVVILCNNVVNVGINFVRAYGTFLRFEK